MGCLIPQEQARGSFLSTSQYRRAADIILAWRTEVMQRCPQIPSRICSNDLCPLLSSGLGALCEALVACCPPQIPLQEHRRHTWFAIDTSEWLLRTFLRPSKGARAHSIVSKGCSTTMQELPRTSMGVPRPSKGFQDLPRASRDAHGFHETLQGLPRAERPKTPKTMPETLQGFQPLQHDLTPHP